MFANTSAAAAEVHCVLIAEDNPTTSEHPRSQLEHNGFTVIAARNGKEALSLARARRPSVVVSDVKMREMDGYALCRELKRDPALKSIPAILVTELSSPQDVFRGIEAGADNFLAKPYEAALLISRIRYLLANQRLRSAGQRAIGIEIEVAGERHLITAERQQILDLLISTYDQAVVLYDRLGVRQKELARSYDTLNALYDLAGGLNRCRTEAEVVAFALERTMRISGVRAGWLNLRGDDGFRLVGTREGGAVAEGVDAACSGCTCQRLLDAGELETARNIDNCERMAGGGAAHGASAHMSIPLTIEGRPAGILNLVGSGPQGVFSEGDWRTLTSVGNQISDALERARLREALERKVEERTRELQTEVVDRRQAEQAARTAWDHLLDAIESIDAGFALYDRDERLVVCNKRYCEMHSLIAPAIVPGAGIEALVRAGLDCGDGPLAQPNEAQVEAHLARHRLADGLPYFQRRGGTWLMSSARRTREGGIVVVETDITDLKKADKAKNEFLAKVSHELRTPLTSIRSALALLDAGVLGTLPVKIHGLVELAHRNCARLTYIVDDLLDVTRINAGNFNFDLRVTGLEPIVDQVVQSKRIGPDAPNIRLKIANRAKHVQLLADPLRIQQVLDNLLSNAIKFSAATSQIDVAATRRGDVVRVSVTDRGSGIPREFQSRVFEPFAQAHSSSTRQKGGAGLGLSIAKSIVEAHHGAIGFSSTEGKGTTFYFDLPIVAATALSPHTYPPAKAARRDGARARVAK